jgi:cytochrome c oxidase assembly protein subunit 15
MNVLRKPQEAYVTDLQKLAASNFARSRLHLISKYLLPLVLLTGFFTAGTSAGASCHTYPNVGDNWFFYGRKHLFNSEEHSFWRNFTENKLVCQVNHRTLGLVMALASTILLYSPLRMTILNLPARYAIMSLIALLWGQYALGVTTILNSVPIPLASAHQCGAMGVLTALLMSLHCCRRVD